MRGLRHRSGKSGRAQALVEFSLVIPIFLLLIISLVDLGRAVYDYSTLTNANRSAIRVAIVNQNTAGIQSKMIAQGVAMNLTTANIDYIAYKAPGDAWLATSTPEKAANCTPVAPGCIAVIKVHYEWSAITPIIGNLIGPIILTNITEMPVEDAFTYP
jgi:Flp pilus assembly protein TadG